MKNSRIKFMSAFKTTMAIESVKECESLTGLSNRFKVHPDMTNKLKEKLLGSTPTAFEDKQTVEKEYYTGRLYTKIGRLEIENDF